MLNRKRFALFAGSALLITLLGWAVTAQQKPAARASAAAQARNTVAVYKSPT